MKEIPLTRGKVALVDDEDFDRINAFKWYALYDLKSGNWYAERRLRIRGSDKRETVRMHRVIMKSPRRDFDVDHKDRNGLNNQKGNLRICTRTLNLGNQKLRKSSLTGFKGVSYSNKYKKFQAKIKFNRKAFFLGYFHTPQEAAVVYNKKAIELFGEFARINQT